MSAAAPPERILVLANASAGSAERDVLGRCQELLAAVAQTRVAWSEGPEELAATLDTLDPRTALVVAGGDGSLNVVVNLLATRRRLSVGHPLALLPLGTGNDFARSAGVPSDPIAAATAAADAIRTGSLAEMDAVVADDGRVVVNAAHVGVGAVAARRGQRLKRALGPLGYVLGAAAAAGTRSLRVAVTVDDVCVTDFDRSVLMVGIGNGRTIGGGTPLAPGAAADDHLLDVVVSFPQTALARLGYALALKGGRHPGRDDVMTMRGREVRVAGEPFEVNEDGELLGDRRERTWRVSPAAWSLYRPSD
ncbi:MAG: diacylglycerol/lipid kinase family protein [Actinomycetales bacterium]